MSGAQQDPRTSPIPDPVVSMMASLPWAAVLIGADGRVLFQNAAARGLQEVTGERAGPGIADLYPARVAALSGEPPWRTPQQVAFTSGSGDTRVREQLYCGTIPNLGCYLLIVDESESVRAEQVRAQTDRLASVGYMLAGVCHEISNPLAATYSMVQILQSQSQLSEDRLRAGLDKIALNVKRILEISRTVYEFSRVGDHRPLPVDLAVQEALEMLRADSRFEALVLVHEPDYQAVIQADRIALRQVFFNLVLNAAQAMGGSGEIRVTTARPSSATVEVRVEDSGPGIPEERLERVFEPFFTTKPSGEGTGLGLAITHDIVREHAGRIDVTNRADGGACFRLTFPLEVGRKT